MHQGGLFSGLNRVQLGRWGQARDVNTPCVLGHFMQACSNDQGVGWSDMFMSGSWQSAAVQRKGFHQPEEWEIVRLLG